VVYPWHLKGAGCDRQRYPHVRDSTSSCRTIADECCFGPPPSPGVINYQLRGWVERDLCGSRPWLVLHKARSVPTLCPDLQRGLQ
jgi:hypothetical protein